MAATLAGAGLLAGVAVIACYQDLHYRRLPNWLCAITLIAGLALALTIDGWQGMPSAFLHMFIALVAGIGLYALGGIGAGDAKFYAAVAAWFPLRHAATLFVSVSLAGLVLLVAWFLLRRMRRRGNRPKSGDSAFDKLPYGIAISLGAIIAFGLTRLQDAIQI